MPAPSPYTIVREILMADIDLASDVVLQKARARGVVAPAEKVRMAIYDVRGQLRRKAAASGTTPVAKSAPAAASSKIPTKPAPKPMAKPTPADSDSSDLTDIFKNVNLVNKVVGIVGGADHARQVAAAVKACGSVEAFLQHVELVEGIRLTETGKAE